MGRFYEGDGDNPISILWWGNFRRIVNSKSGQKKLREIIDALMAVQTRRLIYGAICREGEVCAVGAVAAYKGKLDASRTWEGDQDDTIELGKSAGLGLYLSYELGNANDELPDAEEGYYNGGNGRCKLIKCDDGSVGIISRRRLVLEVFDERIGRTRLEYFNDPVGTFKVLDNYCTPEERWQRIHSCVSEKIVWNLPVPV